MKAYALQCWDAPPPLDQNDAEIPVNPVDVRRSAMDALARREHGTEELSRKLRRRFGANSETRNLIAEQLGRLVDEGLLSDTRFAASLVRQLITRGLGPRRLDRELRAKGIEKAWQACADAPELEVDWFDCATQVYEKKFGHCQWPDEQSDVQKERARRARFMQYRGFEPDHFMHLLELPDTHE